ARSVREDNIYYLPNGVSTIFFANKVLLPDDFPQDKKPVVEEDAEDRYEIRNEVRGEQASLVDAYEWVNQDEGVVRIPVERAMRLTVEELRAEGSSRSETAP
ncbi:MAG: hypothetical protein R6V45_01065, partial [Oceanipulchritudo sp.]